MGFKTAPDATPTSVEWRQKQIFCDDDVNKISFIRARSMTFFDQFIGAKTFSSFFSSRACQQSKLFFISTLHLEKFTVIAGIFIFRKATFSHVNIDIASRCLSNVNRIKLKISEGKWKTKATDFVEHLPSYRFWSSSSTSEWTSGRSAPDENLSELSVTSHTNLEPAKG